MMIPQAIRMAENAVRKYKTRDPFEIIDARKIKLRYFYTMPNLLGYYKVSNRKQYIGLNGNADPGEQRTAAGHELGHSYLDYRIAASGTYFQDTMLYSTNNSRCERNANLFDAELLLSDDDILIPVYYEDYIRMMDFIDEHIDHFRSDRARFEFEQEQLMEFAESHQDMPTFDQLAIMYGVDVHLVEFKLKALEYKGYNLPNIPETKSDFLKRF